MPPSPSRGNRSRKPSSASGGDVAVYFVDSSALVKRYVQEVGTPWVRRLTHRGQAHEIYLASITPVELTAAVARRRRGKTTAKNGARTEQGCFVSFRPALSKTWRPTGTIRRSIQCPTAGQPTPTSDSGNLTCWTGIAPLAGA